MERLTCNRRTADTEVMDEVAPTDPNESRFRVHLALEFCVNLLREVVREDSRATDGIAGCTMLSIGHNYLLLSL